MKGKGKKTHLKKMIRNDLKNGKNPVLITPGGRVMAKTDLEKFLEEEEARAERKQALIDGLLEERSLKMREFDDQLKRLGYTQTIPYKPQGSKQVREKKDAPCSVCGFKTNPIHDARAHRSQKPKTPFTHDELVSRGLSKA